MPLIGSWRDASMQREAADLPRFFAKRGVLRGQRLQRHHLAPGARSHGDAVSNRVPHEAGPLWVNSYRAVSYLAPFGGYKRSGIGRENGQEAIDDYLETKTVWISTAEEMPNPFVMR